MSVSRNSESAETGDASSPLVFPRHIPQGAPSCTTQPDRGFSMHDGDRIDRLIEGGDFPADRSSALQRRRMQNSMAPMCKLPDELLVLILDILQVKGREHDEIFNPAFYSFDWHNAQWVRMTWVCHHIRSVAINSPQLWTWIHSKQLPAWINLTASRSQTASLCIDLEMCHAEFPLHLLSRATSVKIDCWSEHNVDVETSLVQNFPDKLTVLYSHYSQDPATVALLARLANQLVELQAGEANIFMWPKLVWPQLRRLELTDFFMDPEDLIFILNAMKQLEILSIASLQYRRGLMDDYEAEYADTRSRLSKLGLKTVDVSMGGSNAQLGQLLAPGRLEKIIIIDIPRTMIQVLSAISPMKPAHRYHTSLELFPRDDDDLAALLAHLKSDWEWKTSVISSSIRLKNQYHNQYHYDLDLSSEHEGGISTVNIRNVDVKHTGLREHLGVIERLEVEHIEVTKSFIQELDQCSNVRHIIFRHVYGAQHLLTWLESRRTAGYAIDDVVFENCEDGSEGCSSSDSEEDVGSLPFSWMESDW
jgi:hypothetical protein